jgi:hypothetical protein
MADLFDQNEPKSALARSLNDAFAGIDGWSVSPKRRRSTLPDDEPIRIRRSRPASAMHLDAPAWVQEGPSSEAA